ncbi:hypothetical protein HOLleu_22595 [Holothuria leucospilota]|uniref:Uncharacterized protein n=1 Tax=Holothuria leucospilota TaxID=206669 RepID=A0A9Q1BYP1_HOLLE|nr:hypothetical protein HOLleu_22595 [Holothuria leucospilota]
MGTKVKLGVCQILGAIILICCTIAFQVRVKRYLGPFGYPDYAISLFSLSYATFPCVMVIGGLAIYLDGKEDQTTWRTRYIFGLAITELLCFASVIISILSATSCLFCVESAHVALYMIISVYGFLNIIQFILAILT